MVTTKLNLSMTEPQVRQIYAKQGDTGRVLDITLDQTPEDGTLRILRPDGTEVTSEAVTGGSSGSGETVTFESMTEADVTELKANIEPIQLSLPSGYQAIEYIQSTGHEYINTGFVPTSDDGFEIDFITNNDFASSGNYGCIFGARTSSNTLDYQLTTWTSYAGGGERGAVRWGTGLAHDAGLLDNGTRQKASLLQKTYTAPNGSTWSFTSNYTGAYPIYVFSLNQAGSPTQNGSVILYSLKFYRGAFLAMYLVPCKRTSDNKLGLYDVVGGTFLPVVNIDSSANPQGGGNVTLPNPTNPLSITGHDEVTVTRTGKNLLDTDAFASGRSQYYNVNSDGSINVVANDSTAWNNVPYIPLKAGTYTLSWVTQPSGQLRMKTSDDGYSAESYIGAGNKRYTFTLTDDGGIKLKIGINALYPYTEYLQLELGSTATAYEPYQGSTYTTSLGQTVYGGTLDLVTGVLTVDKVSVTYSSGVSRDGSGSNVRFYFTQNDFLRKTEYTTDDIMCDKLPTVRGYTKITGNALGISGYSQPISQYPNNNFIYFGTGDSSITEVADMNTWLANNPLQIVYKLKTPIEYQLTPQQIKTLVGTNNVWASSGDIVNITFTYGGLFSELPSEATEIVGKCYCDVEQNGVSSMPFTLNVKKNERES